MSKPHPALHLRRPLRVGQPVRVNRGVYKGATGVVAEVLTPKTADRYLTGGCRLGVLLGCASIDNRMPGDNITDFARFELVHLTQRRLRDERGSA